MSSTISCIVLSFWSFGKPYILLKVASFSYTLLSSLPNIFLWCFKTFSGKPSRIHGCCKASRGVILSIGFQTKHLLRKSKNFSSLHLSTCDSYFEPGYLTFPLEFACSFGLFFLSKNKWALYAILITSSSGWL